jgi:nucleotide-binding universal stress UspA family protein
MGEMEGIHPKVLVALDGSPAAETALPIATMVARQLGATLEALHVRPGGSTPEELQERFPPLKIRADVTVVEGAEPAEAILKATEEPDVRLVVLTTHGRAIEPGREIGRIAEAVIARTTRPVLLVRPEAAGPPHELRHLLVSLDGTPTTSEAMHPAMELAQQFGASIDLLHVAASQEALPTEPGTLCAPRYVDQPQHEWPEWASEMAARAIGIEYEAPADVPIRSYLKHGQTGPEIARFAVDRQVDAIVVARRSRFEPGRAQVLRAVLAKAPCPILLVGLAADAGGPSPSRGRSAVSA